MTLELPLSLEDLQHAATRHFGHNGRLRLYHKGLTPVHHDRHLQKLKHDDHIVVTWEGRRIEPDELMSITTHKADYVPHPIRPRSSVPQKPRVTPVPFLAESSYKGDYVAHPISSREPCHKKEKWLPKTAPTGSTTYNTHFPWHEVEALRPAFVTAKHTPVPFEGKSSYELDFVEHPLAQRGSMRPARARSTPGKFLGETTYCSDYVPKTRAARPIMRPTLARTAPVPFDADTEYTHRFKEHPIESKVWVHLEPELK